MHSFTAVVCACLLAVASGFVVQPNARSVNSVVLLEKINETIDLESPKVVHVEKLEAGTQQSSS
jgi:proteasome assembly chaperone (PAC2) family protein